MTITAEQLETRKKFLGASDVSAILGLNPFRTAADVWLEKTQDLKPIEDNESIEIGNDFERPMLKWAEKRIGMPLHYDCDTAFHTNGVLACHPDAIVRETDSPVEAKCSAKTDDWGDEGTDVVPTPHLIQVHVQMMCVGADSAYLAAFLGGWRMTRRLYRIPLNVELAKTIDEVSREWWDRHVVAGVMPDAAPSLDVVRRIKPRPGVVVPLDPALAAAYHEAKEKTKIASGVEMDARARLEAALAGADAGECDGWEVVFKKVKVKEYTVAAREDRRLTCKPAN